MKKGNVQIPNSSSTFLLTSTQSFHQETQIPVENALPTLRVKGHCQPTKLAAAKWHEPRSCEENQPMEKQPKKSFWANFGKIAINISNDILRKYSLTKQPIWGDLTWGHYNLPRSLGNFFKSRWSFWRRKEDNQKQRLWRSSLLFLNVSVSQTTW